ncbi:hypothetical protein KYY02_04455 [Streptomyces pimonensis]|uniref:Uncharacterized protein n=1 Tax=Streptomyces pimonensis TaxID=2860288 RepID=A0ABV4ITM8_9ACTN
MIDETRAARDGVLPVMYREKSTGTTPSPLCVADVRPPVRDRSGAVLPVV